MEESVANNCIQRLKHLKTLYDNELITHADFETRKSQIVDELTGTSSGTLKHTQNASKRKRSTHSFVGGSTLDESKHDEDEDGHGHAEDVSACVYNSADPMNIVLDDNERVQQKKKRSSKRKKIEVVRHGPPDWGKIRSEKAAKWLYSYDEEKWFQKLCKVKIDEVPFDKGGLRYVFHLQDLSDPKKKYVAKMSQDMRDNIKKDIYFNDVRMQAIARHFCHGRKGYNSYFPPKCVDFLEAYVLHLKQREGSPVCHVERYIEGQYKKYNNNVGWVSDDERNTPHAFAHFTYEASKGKLLVCDIQGVGDVYTDPQVHSSQNVKAFGRGNLGTKGFENFLRTHRCNVLCQYLKLKNINQLPIKQMGTLPANTQISQPFISTVPFDFEKSGKVPLLSEKGFPKIIFENKEDGNTVKFHDKFDNNQTKDAENTSCWSRCLIL